MGKNRKRRFRRFTAVMLAVLTMVSSVFAPISVSAAQEDHYHDPAENWMSSQNRTSELDANAVVTRESFYCHNCKTDRAFTVWRTPEYTKTGVTALDHDVKFSDGTKTDGSGKGSTGAGTPGVNAYYTSYHWTKASCDTCGVINSNFTVGSYPHGRNIYYLYDCASEFIQKLDDTVTYEYVDSTYHKKNVKGGEYCLFCYGTNYKKSSELVRHTMNKEIYAQPANNRFAVVQKCNDCDYKLSEYVMAKSVVADYYGKVDGKPHTVTVSDLSESSVKTQIRYGNSAENCNLASAPNYTEAGNYPVYYEITYTLGDKNITENGVAWVMLKDTSSSTGNIGCGCGKSNCGCTSGGCNGSNNGSSSSCGSSCNGNCGNGCGSSCGSTCNGLCGGNGNCGAHPENNCDKNGHTWQQTVIREATCETDGKILEICKECSEVRTTLIAKTDHKWRIYSVEATCVSPGYTVRECEVCGKREISDITTVKPHEYVEKITPAGCETGGHTTHICYGCGNSFVTDRKDPLGHNWDNGKTIAGSSCVGDGVKEYTCERCGVTRIEGTAANGHTPGASATCTEPQICQKCGAVISTALGHDYHGEVKAPECEKMGYTLYTCSRCGDSYKSDYTDPSGHKAGAWIIDKEATIDSEGKKHTECVKCGEIIETAVIPKIGTLSHESYIVGYPDGTFAPAKSMTRAEASAIFARLLASANGDRIYGEVHTAYSDVLAKSWYSGYVRYLDSTGIISGYSDGTFRPSAPVTRAEFTTMAVNFYEVYKKTSGVSSVNSAQNDTWFSDINSEWFADYIRKAAANGWVNGYTNGTFAGNSLITRAEVVTIVNRVLDRAADTSYVDSNRKVIEFKDVNSRHWAYYDIAEAANSHMTVAGDNEQWF